MTEVHHDRRKMSAQERKFRRGLYVMLVALGILAAGSMIYARDSVTSGNEARAAAQEQKAALLEQKKQNAYLLHELGVLLDLQAKMQRTQNERSAKASAERAQLLARIQKLELFIIEVLKNSSDPEIRKAAQGSFANPTPAPGNSPTSVPTPRPTQSVPASPTPSPSPTPFCVRTPAVTICRP